MQNTGSIDTKFLKESKTAAGKKIGIFTTYFFSGCQNAFTSFLWKEI